MCRQTGNKKERKKGCVSSLTDGLLAQKNTPKKSHVMTLVYLAPDLFYFNKRESRRA